MKNRQCEEVGYIDKGFGKHQSNTVYSGGGCHHVCAPHSESSIGYCCSKSQRNRKYQLVSDYSYCLDANYHKGITLEQYLLKHRRQLIIEIT